MSRILVAIQSNKQEEAKSNTLLWVAGLISLLAIAFFSIDFKSNVTNQLPPVKVINTPEDKERDVASAGIAKDQQTFQPSFNCLNASTQVEHFL